MVQLRNRNVGAEDDVIIKEVKAKTIAKKLSSTTSKSGTGTEAKPYELKLAAKCFVRDVCFQVHIYIYIYI